MTISTIENAWYRWAFDDRYFTMYEYACSARVTPDLQAIDELLRLEPGSKLLDLCCGYGRHAIPLAQAGHAVTGLDISEHLLDIARSKARTVGVDVEWVHADMREIGRDGEFHAVLCLYNSFGYLESDADHQRALDSVARALQPGGSALLELANRESVLRQFDSSRFAQLGDGRAVGEERSFDLSSSVLTQKCTIVDGSTTRQVTYLMRLYTLTELQQMMRSAGLVVERLAGGLDGRPLTMDSSSLVLLAKKPHQPN